MLTRKIEISVVIPAFNAAPYIGECLTSVLSQEDAPRFEVIVVDDGSRDRTSDLVTNSFPSVKLLSKPNGGPGSARNRGVAAARGDVIIFIDADDIMLPGRLADQGRHMLENDDVVMSIGNAPTSCEPNRNKNVLIPGAKTKGYWVCPDIYRFLLLNEFVPAHTACAVRRDAYLYVGGQREDVFVHEDYHMNLQLARFGKCVWTQTHFSLLRRENHGNLMASGHTYYGPVRVLHDELDVAQRDFPTSDFNLLYKRWTRKVDMLLRYNWIEHGRNAVERTIDEFERWLPVGLRRKWIRLAYMPPTLGYFARWVNRKLS